MAEGYIPLAQYAGLVSAFIAFVADRSGPLV